MTEDMAELMEFQTEVTVFRIPFTIEETVKLMAFQIVENTV